MSKTKKIIGLTVVALTVAGCAGVISSVAGTVASPKPATKVTFELLGKGTVNATYGINGQQSQQLGKPLPFKVDVDAKRDGTPVIAVVLGQIETGNKIECRVSIDGEVVATNVSTGMYSNVTCTGVKK